MVEVTGGRMGERMRFAPLPPFSTPQEILADALPVLDPPSRMSVTDAAERHLRVQLVIAAFCGLVVCNHLAPSSEGSGSSV